MKGSRWLIVALVSIVFMVIPLGSAIAADSVNLVYGSTEGINHTFSKADHEWIEAVGKMSNGRIKITPYWGATLLSRRENTNELIKGVADLGYVSPRTGYPLMLGTFGFPYGVGIDDWEIVYKVDKELRKKFPQLDGEWSALKIMAYSVASNYQLISTKPVRSAADFKGLMVKATGLYVDIVKELGGDGLYVPMGETYVALQKGTIDACLAPMSTVPAFKFNEVAKYITLVNLSSSVRPSRAMNLDSYNKKVPKDLQSVLDQSVEFWSEADNKWRYQDDLEGFEICKQTGVEIIELPKAELEKIYAATEKACLAEAKKLDEQGLPGTAIFKETRRLIDQYQK